MIWWLGIFSITVLYFLSPPLVTLGLFYFKINAPDWLGYVYAPIILLYDQFEPVKNFYDGYSELLGVDL